MSEQLTHGAATFPHPAYARHILRPAFEEAQRLLFGPMLEANAAHLIMLAATDIITGADAGRVLAALRGVAERGAEAFIYAPAVEDLFFAVEQQLIADAGADAGGNLQIARSRNDLDAVMCRLMLRDRLLDLGDRLVALRGRLLAFAAEHVETIMPGTTHTQPAQPTTLAHWLAGVLGPLERDTARVRDLYGRVNRNPMGVAAFTTTGFPIDRALTTELLGFDGLVENGYDAVGAADSMLEAVGTLSTAATSLSRFVHDLLIWSRQEVGILRVGDEFVQISSIMPQKRNPVVFEHIRARVGYVLGDAATVTTIAHNSAFGDTVDVEDEIYLPLARGFVAMASILDLLTVVFATIKVDRDLLASRAGRGFTTTTELADTLVRRFGLSFRSAHSVVAEVVKDTLSAGGDTAEITVASVETAAQRILGRELGIDEITLRTALDPRAFVEARTVPGGPAPAAMRRSLAACDEQLEADRRWLAAARDAITAASARRQRRADALIDTRR